MNYAIKRNRTARARLIRIAAILGIAIMAVSGAHECSNKALTNYFQINIAKRFTVNV